MGFFWGFISYKGFFIVPESWSYSLVSVCTWKFHQQCICWRQQILPVGRDVAVVRPRRMTCRCLDVRLETSLCQGLHHREGRNKGKIGPTALPLWVQEKIGQRLGYKNRVQICPLNWVSWNKISWDSASFGRWRYSEGICWLEQRDTSKKPRRAKGFVRFRLQSVGKVNDGGGEGSGRWTN